MVNIDKISRRTKFGFIVVVAIVFLSNILPVKLFIDGLFISCHFETKNSEFQFTLTDNKDKIEWMENRFQVFLKNNPQTNDTVIYRTFEKNPFKFWNWKFYMESELYDYELKN